MDGESIPEFEGKVVTFYLSPAPVWAEMGLVLESPKLVQRGGRLFLHGHTVEEQLPDGKADWGANLEAGVAWDLVFYYLVMGTLDEWRQWNKKHDES
jgi:hypothetical protein